MSPGCMSTLKHLTCHTFATRLHRPLYAGVRKTVMRRGHGKPPMQRTDIPGARVWNPCSARRNVHTPWTAWPFLCVTRSGALPARCKTAKDTASDVCQEYSDSPGSVMIRTSVVPAPAQELAVPFTLTQIVQYGAEQSARPGPGEIPRNRYDPPAQAPLSTELAAGWIFLQSVIRTLPGPGSGLFPVWTCVRKTLTPAALRRPGRLFPERRRWHP
jgi:hypothetical protein